MSSVFSDLVQRTLIRLSHAAGTSVQVYSEQIVAEMMQYRFDQLFESRWWEDYWRWHTSTLLPEGVTSDNLSDPAGANLDRYTDIAVLFYDQDEFVLPRSRRNVNPQRWVSGQGARPRMHEPYNGVEGKFFRVLPYGSTQQIHIGYRERPDAFVAESEVLMDDQLLILGTAYDYLEEDGTNPGATAKMLGFYNSRLEAVQASVNEMPVPLNDGYTPNQQPWGYGDHSA